MRKFFLILFLPLALAPVFAHAGTYVLPASRDAWLDEGNPMNNFGADPELRQRDHPTTGDNRSLIHFDLSGIPAGEAVLSAYVRLYVTNADESGLPVNIYRVTKNWPEGGVNWNNSGNDYDGGTIHGSFSLPAVGLYAVDVASLVRLWVDGVFSNHGMMLIATSDDIESKFASREWPTPGQTPTLYIVTGDTSMRLATGTYTGDGNNNTPITGVGFRPDVVIVKGDVDQP
ncbi:MAG: DNRLRE domain-containing protein, partial [Candidatus Krumholzibacteria bacterium]|nr:DNRLRE domain-containing protein [Candidatus Krumholzibacteria bacterium]